MSSSVSKKEDGKGRSRKKDRKREASFLPVSVSAELARQHVSAAKGLGCKSVQRKS